MAAVYLAQDRRLHRRVALKVLAPDLARDAAFRTSVIRESRAAAAVDHPHIIPVYEADEASGTLYVAMRYVRGGDARSLLNRLGPLPFGYAWHIIAQIASALDAAHAHGLVHRDVRPGNILLDASDPVDGGTSQRVGDSEFDHAYLSDFGMSTGFSPGQIIARGPVHGNARLRRAGAHRGTRPRRPGRPLLAGLHRVRAAMRHAAVRARPGPDPDVRAALCATSERYREAP